MYALLYNVNAREMRYIKSHKNNAKLMCAINIYKITYILLYQALSLF